jgi:hypothetical protein
MRSFIICRISQPSFIVMHMLSRSLVDSQIIQHRDCGCRCDYEKVYETIYETVNGRTSVTQHKPIRYPYLCLIIKS